MKVVCLAGAIALIIPAAAHAQAHVQVHAGLDRVSAGIAKDKDIAFGFAAGYDFPIGGNAFVGVEGSVDASKAKACETGTRTIIGTVVVPYETCAKSGRDLSAVVRAGMRIGDESKVYALGGYTNAQIKTVTEVELITGVPVRSSSHANEDGFRLGLGLEHNFSSHFFGKVEYRYSDYEGGFARHNGLVAVGFTF